MTPRRRRARALWLLSTSVVVFASVAIWLWLALRGEQVPGATRIDQARSWQVGPVLPSAPPSPAAAGEPTSLPDNWDGQRRGYVGYVWYRIELPTDVSRWHRPALYLPVTNMNAQLWVDGRPVAGRGRMANPWTRHFYTPQLWHLPVRADRSAAGTVTVDILLVGVTGYRSGLAPVWAGEYETLYPAWRWRTFWQSDGTLVTIVFSVALGLYASLIGWRERSLRAYAWFGAAMGVWGLRNLNLTVLDPPLSDLLFAEICVAGAAWFVALFAIFALRFAELEDAGYRGPRWLPPMALVYALVATVHFLTAPDYESANNGFVVLSVAGIALTVWSQWRLVRLAWRHPRIDLAVVATGASLYLALLVNDFLIASNRTTLGEVYIRQYASLPLFLAITATLARRFFAALRRERELASSLQHEVELQRRQIAQNFDALRLAEAEQARHEERGRLMGDLHDSLGLHLVTALRQARTDTVSRTAIAATLQDCMDDLRVAIDSLDANERDPLVLLGTLRFRMAPRFESVGVKLHWNVDDDLESMPALDAEGALHLLRIVQEALGNALRHSGAKEVTLAVRLDDGASVIEVADDGIGFDPSAVRPGRGLGQLRSRAARLGATLTWMPRAGGGTLLRLRIPNPPAEAAGGAAVRPPT